MSSRMTRDRFFGLSARAAAKASRKQGGRSVASSLLLEPLEPRLLLSAVNEGAGAATYLGDLAAANSVHAWVSGADTHLSDSQDITITGGAWVGVTAGVGPGTWSEVKIANASLASLSIDAQSPDPAIALERKK